MRLLAGITLTLAAAAVAARSAGETVPESSPTFAIKTISYTDITSTQICLKDVDGINKNDEFSLMKSIENGISQETYTGKFSNNCIVFNEAGIPTDRDIVVYTLGFDPQGDEEKIIKNSVRFTFIELKSTDPFECDGKKFVRLRFGNDPPEGSIECINNDNSNKCFQENEHETDPRCIQPLKEDGSPKDFEYCQNNLGNSDLTSAANDQAKIATLSYINEGFELAGAVEGDAVFFNEDDANKPIQQAVTLTTSKTTSVAFAAFDEETFAASTSTYTMCVLVKNTQKALDTVTPANKITDLEIKGKLYKEADNQTYYEFGFNYDEVHKNFQAKNTAEDTAAAVSIDCSNLTKGQRCYGYLPATEEQKVTISYNDTVEDNTPSAKDVTELKTIAVEVLALPGN